MRAAIVVLLGSLNIACGSTTSAVAGSTPAAANSAGPAANPGRYPFVAADVHFMSGMIGHHEQAVTIARWAETHGASAAVRTLAGRIINGQLDEIVIMKQWLTDRGQPLPRSGAMMMTMNMGGVEHEMAMPGMLTEAQLRQLDAARGPEFDRLFLTLMIQHHRGAVEMAKALFETDGAAQDEVVFKFASDVNTDQTTEIARMQRMLVDLIVVGGSP